MNLQYMLQKILKKLFKKLAKSAPFYQLRALSLKWAGYKIGENVFVNEDLIIIDKYSDSHLLTIGDRVAIAARVTLVLSSEPHYSRIKPFVPLYHGPINIKNDAWIGTGTIILPNVVVGEGAIVGAGSVVTEDVPDYSVAVGSPARVIKKLNIEKDQLHDVALFE